MSNCKSYLIWLIVAKCFGANNIQEIYSNVGNGVKHGFHMVISTIPGGFLQFVGQYGKNRNKACFEKNFIKNPLEIICHAYALMKYWAGLFAERDREQLEEGVATMMRVATELLANQQRGRSWTSAGLR